MAKRWLGSKSSKDRAMEKHQLVQHLRQRQYHLGLLERRIIDAFSDNELIDFYVTCSCCGKQLVSRQILDSVIQLITNINQFFEFCDSLTHAQPVPSLAPRRARRGRVRGRR